MEGAMAGRGVLGVAAIVMLLGSAGAAAQSAPRGQMLYDNHCIACHNQQVHWREQRLVTNWESLKHWVRHWQREGRLDWSDDEINDVAQYLNNLFYRFRPPGAVSG
jgi:mono/diheme cytochrome c family protein